MKQIAERLLDIGAVVIRDEAHLFTWASGIKSPIYCDNRLTLSYPEVRDMIAQGFVELLKHYEPADVLVGTATAGIAHAAYLSQKTGQPMAYVRASAKEHGKQNKIEGQVRPGDKVIVIEDLISTGGSSIAAAEALREGGAQVLAVLAIVDYGFQEAKRRFAEASLSYESLITYQDILPIAVERGLIDPAQHTLLSAWADDPRKFTP